MPVVTFYTSCKEETGNTVSAIALATFLGITQNKKTLLLSTGLNDNTIKESLWPVQNKKRSGLFGPNTNVISQNGIEDLDRMIRSNRISPEIIPNYTRVALKGRLEALSGYNGSDDQYKEIQHQYPQIIQLASKYYDTVIVDIDRRLEMKTKLEIIHLSDIIIGMTTQKLANVSNLISMMEEGTIVKKENTLITLGKYDEKLKYNAKNITRTMLKQNDIINTIPYNSMLFEAVQEGKVIDIFWKFLNLKIKDENYFLIQELQRLSENIGKKMKEIQMKR